jgi:GDP/UDP-N,N'-diacetylbacillosamine 2-epimerase (hydrolysing)
MTIPRNIALVTTARSDWGIQRPVAAALAARSDVALHIVAGGMHLRREFGHTLDDIIRDGFRVAHRLDYLAAGDGPDSIGKSIGDGVSAFSALLARWQPDLITVLGDRFEMIPAALAATPFAIPIAHLHGGEITRGAFDDQLRHALTKLAHLHLVATEDSARRVRQMGEDPARIHVVGAPGLDDVVNREPVDAGELRKRYGFEPGATNLLVVYHPETRSAQSAADQMAAVLAAVARFDARVVIVRPNADPRHGQINATINAFAVDRASVRAETSIPRRDFLALMASASALVGNSSAGIIEAASVYTPVVNIGERQAGRLRGRNVIDVAADAATVDANARIIAAAVERATAPGFRTSLRDLENPYGDGRSGPRIAQILAATPLTPQLLRKPFCDWR